MTRVRIRDSALVVYLFTVIMAGTTLPTPLYAIYSEDLSLSPVMITVIYAVYAVGVMATLQVLGRLSDQVGRRVVLVTAVALSALSAVLFMTTENLPALFAGRLVSGVSAGLVTGAATAYLTELEAARSDHGRAAVLSTVANMGGLGLGPLIAGVFAEHWSPPTVLPFVADLVLLAPVVLVAVVALPETVRERHGWREGVGFQRMAVPPQIRLPFAAAAVAGFAAFALLGFCTSLIGQVLGEGLGNRSHQTAGVIVFLLFAGVTAAQLVAGRLSQRVGALSGLTVLSIGSFVLVAAEYASSLALLVLAVVVGGIGDGLAFRAGLSSVTSLAPPERRGEVISAFFLIAYVGITIPVVAAGVLVTTTSLEIATTALAVLIAVLSAGAGVAIFLLTRGGEPGPASGEPRPAHHSADGAGR